jgi:hypothetical protein
VVGCCATGAASTEPAKARFAKAEVRILQIVVKGARFWVNTEKAIQTEFALTGFLWKYLNRLLLASLRAKRKVVD